MQSYINIARAQDLENPKERVLYRLLEILPGFLSWATLILALLLSWKLPVGAAIFIILFDFYWLLKVIYLSFHQVASFFQMRKNLKINWLEKIKNIEGWERIYHLIILPTYKEERKIIESSIEALVNSDYPKEKMMVVLAVEERAGSEIQKMAKEIEKKFSKSFYKFLVSLHPKNLPNEIPGKGSNESWAIKVASEKIIKPSNIKKEDIIVSSFDIDTRPYPRYFSCLTFRYLTAENPQRSSFQPIPVYNNNIWLAPAFSRLVATSNTFWQMMQQERTELLVTYSSHSLPFKVLEEVDYPKNVVSDDSRIFWKAYLFYDGNYKVIPLHYPVSMDAVLAKNLYRTIINQYKQQRRWAWGCNDMPFLIFGFLKNNKINLAKKFQHLSNIFDGFWSWATTALLIFFLGWLPLILGGESFGGTLLSYSLPRLTRSLMTLAMTGMVVSAVLSFLMLPPKPKNFGIIKNVVFIFQWLLLPLTLIVFGAIPALDSQTRLILGKYLDFWPTEKISPDQGLTKNFVGG